MRWYELDPGRLEHERSLLRNPWELVERGDGRLAWEGGTLVSSHRRRETPRRDVSLIYPKGFPARFIEARLDPDPPQEQWGMWLAHVNADGSACYVTADGWRPQDTVRDALKLLDVWWWNYYWTCDPDAPRQPDPAFGFPWPRGKIAVP